MGVKNDCVCGCGGVLAVVPYFATSFGGACGHHDSRLNVAKEADFSQFFRNGSVVGMLVVECSFCRNGQWKALGIRIERRYGGILLVLVLRHYYCESVCRFHSQFIDVSN